MRIPAGFRHMPLKRMIALLVVLFSLLPSLVMSLFAYRVAAGQAEERISVQVSQTAQHVNSELNMVINEASRLMNYSSSYTISNFLSSSTPEARYENAKALGELFSIIRQTQSSNSYILDMSVIGINGRCFSERNGYFNLERPFESYEDFQAVVSLPRTVHVQGSAQSLRGQPWEDNALTVSAAVFKISTNEVCGLLRVSVSKDFIVDILKNAKPSPGGQTLVMDGSGVDLFPSQGSVRLSSGTVRHILEDGTSGTIKSNQALVVYTELPSTGWTIVSVAPTSEVFSSVYQLRASTVLMVLVSILLIVAVNILLSSYIAHPISQLKSLMRSATSGNLDVEIPEIHGQVEIEEVYRSFAALLRETKNLLARIVEEQKNLKKAELTALQSQINPHFLYNTLDSAVWAAESNKNEEAVDLIASLSDFYRLSLRSGMDVIPFETEVNHVSCYLHIMQMRYQDILSYHVDVAPETLRARFPKIILQPIVENAIYHGIKNRRYRRGETGHVEVRARKIPENLLEITVSDTGIGMSPEALAALSRKIDEGVLRSGQSYGLINVNMRLRLMFGEGYTLTLRSQEGCGTQVIIRVPLTEEEDNGL